MDGSRASIEQAQEPSVAVRLAQLARHGDREAFGRLHQHFAPMVFGILLSRVRRVDAEDLSQEVFLAAWKALPTLRSDAHVGGWLATIARNAAARHHQRARPAPEALPETLPDLRGRTAQREAEGAELLEVLRGLPETYRESLVLRLVEGMSGPQIAELIGLSPGSVRTHLARGLELLREALRRKGWR